LPPTCALLRGAVMGLACAVSKLYDAEGLLIKPLSADGESEEVVGECRA
jgi:hypothetical protein